MFTANIECTFSQLQDSVLPLLRGRVLHLTDLAALEVFQRQGAIPAGYHGRFGGISCPGETSYGARRGYVCLSDFRIGTKTELEEAFIRHYFLKPFYYATTCCYLAIAPSAWSKVIPWTHARSDVGAREVYIPFVEAWYPGDLPLELITECLVVRVQPTADALRDIIGQTRPKATA